jgi:hypothetical protein
VKGRSGTIRQARAGIQPIVPTHPPASRPSQRGARSPQVCKLEGTMTKELAHVMADALRLPNREDPGWRQPAYNPVGDRGRANPLTPQLESRAVL